MLLLRQVGRSGFLRFVGQDDTLLDNPHAKMMLLQSARQSRTLREALRPIIENRCPEMLAALEPVNVEAKVIDESDPHEVAEPAREGRP